MIEICMPDGSTLDLCLLKPPEDPPTTLVSSEKVAQLKQKHHEVWSFYQDACVNNCTSTGPKTDVSTTTVSDTTTRIHGTTTFLNSTNTSGVITSNQDTALAGQDDNSMLHVLLYTVLAIFIVVVILVVLFVIHKKKPEFFSRFSKRREFYCTKDETEANDTPQCAGGDSQIFSSSTHLIVNQKNNQRGGLDSSFDKETAIIETEFVDTNGIGTNDIYINDIHVTEKHQIPLAADAVPTEPQIVTQPESDVQTDPQLVTEPESNGLTEQESHMLTESKLAIETESPVLTEPQLVTEPVSDVQTDPQLVTEPESNGLTEQESHMLTESKLAVETEPPVLTEPQLVTEPESNDFSHSQDLLDKSPTNNAKDNTHLSQDGSTVEDSIKDDKLPKIDSHNESLGSTDYNMNGEESIDSHSDTTMSDTSIQEEHCNSDVITNGLELPVQSPVIKSDKSPDFPFKIFGDSGYVSRQASQQDTV